MMRLASGLFAFLVLALGLAARAVDGTHDARAYLPSIADPASTIVATYEDPQASGPSGTATVAFEDRSGQRRYLQVPTDAAHKLTFKVAAGAVAVWLTDAKTVISRDATVTGTEPVSNIARAGPAIERAATAYERGGSSGGIFDLQTRGVDPLHAKVLVDGNSLGAETLAASDRSIKARFADSEPLGRHSIAVSSGSKRSNAIKADLVTMRADPLPPGETGSIQTLRVHVNGLPRTDKAVMNFQIAGSARLENGGEAASVPVTNGVAEVRIRGEHSGPALVSFHVAVNLGDVVAEELPRTTSRESPAPGQRGPEPSPSGGPTPGDIGKPNIYGHEGLTPCNVTIDDGWFEPSQGVWQDDRVFTDHRGKQIDRTDHGGNPTYYAELPMIEQRDTFLYGMMHYEKNNVLKDAGTFTKIHMTGLTTCNGPPEKVRMRFTAISGGTAERIYTSSVLDERIPFTGGRIHAKRWTADLSVQLGVPIDGHPYEFTSTGAYTLEDELLRENKPTGLKVIVKGNVIHTRKLLVGFVPIEFGPYFQNVPGSLSENQLTERVGELSSGSQLNIPDFYPMSKGAWSSELLLPDDLSDSDEAHDPGLSSGDADTARRARWKVQDYLAHRYEVMDKEGGYDRIVVAPSAADMEREIDPEADGMAFASTVVAVEAQQNYTTVAHEIAHTLPYLWSVPQMAAKCTQPGDYHNLLAPYAHGVHIDVGGVATWPSFVSYLISYMGGESYPPRIWTDQCTYWHLANALSYTPDPTAMLVHGELNRGSAPKLWPAYIMPMAEDIPRGSGQDTWHLTLRSAAGAALATYSFNPVWVDEDGRPRKSTTFMYAVPATAGAAAIDLGGPHGEHSHLQALASHIGVSVVRNVLHRGLVDLRWHIAGGTTSTVYSDVYIHDKNGVTIGDPIFEQHTSTAIFRLPNRCVKAKCSFHVLVTDNIHTASAYASITSH